MTQKKILLIEDEENIAIAIRILMEREGYAFFHVNDGAQALPNIRAQEPDLIILDVTLPGMSGYEICQQLRQDQSLAQPPVLMMSARASDAEQRKGLAMGADQFVTKPFGTEALKSAVADLLAAAQSGGSDET